MLNTGFMTVTSGGVSEIRARSLVQLNSIPLNQEQKGERALKIVSEQSAVDIFIDHPINAHAIMYQDNSILLVVPPGNWNQNEEYYTELLEHLRPKMIYLAARDRLSDLCIKQ